LINKLSSLVSQSKVFFFGEGMFLLELSNMLKNKYKNYFLGERNFHEH